jgi:hypothetical protein
MRLTSLSALLALTASLAGGCVTYAEDLNRGQRHFEGSEYERALAIFRVLEKDMDSLSPTDRTRYAYLRGMTDYRMSYRADARHWLALSRALDQATPGGLQEPWKERMQEALKDLNNDVYGGAEPTGADGGAPAPNR